MSSNRELLTERNKQIRSYANTLAERYPHWKYDYILEKTSKKFFLTPRTIEAIIKEEGNYRHF